MPANHRSGSRRTGDFFGKYGIEADLVFISSGSLNVQALVGNTVQFAAGGPQHWKRGCVALNW